MPSSELAHLVAVVLDSVDQTELRVGQILPDDLVSKLHSVLPENIIIAALDIIDKENVIKHTTPWAYPHFEIHGSDSTYGVTLGMIISPISFYCSCPAFAYAVLLGGSQTMCKHILATWIADKFSLCAERPMSQNDLELLIVNRQSTILNMNSN